MIPVLVALDGQTWSIDSMREFWDEWIGSLDGLNTVMLIKRVYQWGNLRIDIHKMVSHDEEECYHTHPRLAIRLILWGGYIEQLSDGTIKTWKPFNIGIVRPSYCHRIMRLYEACSYSLWIRLPTKKHEIKLVGEGWGNAKLTGESK